MEYTTVFLSSTQGHLAEYRDAVCEAINKLDSYRCIRMEEFGARDLPSLELCIEKVKQCDCFVALVGLVHGSCPEGEDRSYSEIEYDTAIEAGMPRLVFVCPPDFPVPGNLRETKKEWERQQAFRARVDKDRQRASFASKSDAALAVIEALFNWQSRRDVREVDTTDRSMTAGSTTAKELGELPASVRGTVSLLPDDASWQRSEALGTVAAAFASGELDFKESDSDSVGSFHVARLLLLAKTFFARRCTNECLTTHEVNVLYKYRQQLRVDGWESGLIWRSLIGDPHDVVPGWYWFKSDESRAIEVYLWHTAMHDVEPSIKARSLQLLTKIHATPAVEFFGQKDILGVIASDDSPEVQKSLLEYLAENGTNQDLMLVGQIINTGRSSLQEIGRKAEWNIKIKNDPKGALIELINLDSLPAGAIAALNKRKNGLPVELLEKAIAHKSEGLRKFAVRVLIERKRLSKESAYALLNHDSVQVRALSYSYLISLGERFTTEQIREALKQSDSSAGGFRSLSSLAERVDDYSVIYTLYKCYTYEELVKQIDWFSVSGPIAYRVMAECHFPEAANRIRQDLEERFEALRSQSIDRIMNKIRKRLKDVPTAIQDEAIENAAQELREADEKVAEFTRGRFISGALSGFALHCEEKDILIARRYLAESRSEFYGEVEVEAAKIVAKFGDASDAPLLASLAKQLQGDKRTLVLKSALALSPGAEGIARQLLQEDSIGIFELAAESLVTAGDPQTRDILKSFLLDENASKRERAVAFLAKICSTGELVQLLDGYIERGSYFYNVACWLDRFLFAPEPLKKLYTEQLMADAVTHSKSH